MIPNNYEWKFLSNNPNKSIIDNILAAKNILDSDKESFLNPKIADLHDPFALLDMDKAVIRILDAISQKQQITIYGDYDADGITSTSVLYMFLTEVGAKVNYYIPNRFTEGYGMNIDAILYLADNKTDLIVTVDNGITAIAEVDFARSKGIDVIITDHHQCLDQIPDAHCIVNYKRPNCTYPSQNLAGVGIVFKLITAIATTLKLSLEEYVYKYLDLVSIGTIADMVPLLQESRVIASLGLKLITHTRNPGLRALLNIINKNSQPITSYTIAFQVAPRINAISRMSDANLAIELFTTQDTQRAATLAQLLDNNNIKRKAKEAEIVTAAFEYVKNNIDLSKEKVLVITGTDWHHGVLGLVASKISQHYYRPTIVCTLDGDKYVGSARSIDGFSIINAITEQQQYLIKYGGHTQAAGLTISASKIRNFTEDINKANYEILDKQLLTPKIYIDATVPLSEVTIDLYNSLSALEPCGQNNSSPILLVKGKISKIIHMGKRSEHLKIILEDNNKFLDVIIFSQGQLSNFLNKGEEVEIAGSISKNEWNGKTTIQFMMTAIRSANETTSLYYLELYTKFQNSPMTHLKGLSYYEITQLIPSYSDCAAVFQYLKKYAADNISLNQLSFTLKLNEYKILQIIDIFCELGFLSYKYNNNSIYYRIESYAKNKLENSTRFNQLSQFLKGE
ncbi:single-stranded-DNA-specific exonuclease RecJ [Candidatus Epulonipiscium viviparus]|uniref:single-stranded-DNA-specific exonuclease RecJ n=1 Tax=Candidatus Epulonipiscium viviparus TaxID=420336 RepID=UPI00016BFB11|nr:single-stranded-DNA-specific exonuclease RecJ [Candidatus Epulopiscium viviparus]